MKIIQFDEIKNLNINYSIFYAWANEVIKNKNDFILPPKISMKQEGHIFYNVMPSILPTIKTAGLKLVTRYPNQEPSLNAEILLYDLNNGKLEAIMDGTYITTVRTGAVAANAIETLAIKKYQSIAFVGLGNTARATLLSLLSQIRDRQLTIKLMKYKDQAQDFINRFKEYQNINFIIVDSYEELIKNSDVIVSCVTYFEENISKDEWYKEGCLLVPVHTMGFQNCDIFFDKIIVDDISHVKDFKNFARFKYCRELTDVIKDISLGRSNNNERIIAYNIGISIQDIYFAKKVLELVSLNKKEIELQKPQNKFWI